ncbi:MAG: competence/damage-inducible protein A [Planctomycetota bacterium]|jgi:nicotinamide-nucleotide amidase
MKGIIISVGDELVSGQVVDTNAAYLAGELVERGIEVLEHLTVGDDVRQIARAIEGALELAELVVVSGGLGPTQDDVTREALAQVMGSELVLDETLLGELEEYFARRGRKMAETNRVQAMIPRGCEVLPNRIGTAAGIAGKMREGQVFVFPGVPQEMQQMFGESLAPRLPDGEGVILHRMIHTFGVGESVLADKLANLMARSANPTLGLTVSTGVVSVRITARAGDRQAARKLTDDLTAQIRNRLGELVFGEGDETLASAVGKLLRQHGATLSVAESCTAGMLGAMVTEVPGSSDYFLGGVIAYSNELKERLLGVPHELITTVGAVSEQVAAAMAEGARQTLHSDYAISITGIAGPGGTSRANGQKPVGLVYIALCCPEGCEVHRHDLSGTREAIRRRSALAAINHLRLKLEERNQ